ncbi:MAG: hypothetical protein GH151_10635 [Bacteroidetes bacterium]|nr:hypothetical protein [Bacteroidota bacterium]
MHTLIVSIFLSLVLFSKANAQWQKLFLRDAMGLNLSSSELDEVNPFEDLGKYGAHNLFDRDFSTAWVEGVEGNGIGESVYIGIGKELKDYLYVANGYQKTDVLYYYNNRVKAVRLSLFVTFMLPGDVTEIGVNLYTLKYDDVKMILLKDTIGAQRIDFPFDQMRVNRFKNQALLSFGKDYEKEIEERSEVFVDSDNDYFAGYIMLIEIREVYKGSKWDDTCISDIWFSSEKKFTGISGNEKITDVYKNDDDGSIYVNTTKREKIILVNRKELEKEEDLGEGEHLSLVLMDVSPDKEWAQVDYLYGYEGPGRIEEIAYLYSVRLLTRVDKVLLGNAFSMYGFEEKNGRIYVDTDKGLVDLNAVYYELELLRKKK